MTCNVELIVDRNCPNVDAAREQLTRALVAAQAPAVWREWDREDPDAPGYVRQYGSPTILVNGRDVSGDGTESQSNCCRVYQTQDGIRGVPTVVMIVAALESDQP